MILGKISSIFTYKLPVSAALLIFSSIRILKLMLFFNIKYTSYPLTQITLFPFPQASRPSGVKPAQLMKTPRALTAFYSTLP